jgi:ATP-binding cassette subfamily B (MDR/TAP) protein 1
MKDVKMSYPARPQRQILNGISLTVPPGKIAALVGQSGGGKSRLVCQEERRCSFRLLQL